ncbi:MAG: TVP38/TMEM64 family protein [Nitrospirae bacterium]|nr:TVP38/TMEM64 family protein [Nitrospirota bacterium]
MKNRTAKIAAIASVVAVTLIIFIHYDIGAYLAIAHIKESRDRLRLLYDARPAFVLGAYMLTYVLITAVSLPGAAALTLAGGAMFGLVTGTVAVSFASSIGATLAMIVSRYAIGEWVQARYGERLAAVNAGVERDGAFYLFSLRLIPVFPFFIINLLMGLTKMPVRTFYWVSQVGMIPATIVYVNAGRELGRIDSASGILSPGLLASFALVGVMPIAARKLIQFYRAKSRG